jgi:hypothetical protein
MCLLCCVCQGTAGPGADPEGPADGERSVPRTQEDKTSAQVPDIFLETPGSLFIVC